MTLTPKPSPWGLITALIALLLVLRPANKAQADEQLPAFGDYVYVEELPEAITRIDPTYPPAAKEAGIEGLVLVQALVGADGAVHDTRVVNSIPGLDEAAVAAVRQWRFKPAMAGGKPVAVWVAVPVKFVATPGTTSSSGKKPPPPTPTSMPREKVLSTDAFNARVAAAKDSSWTRSAMLVALAFVGADCQCARFSLEFASKPEQFDAGEIFVTRDGMLDDSIRGDLYRLRLSRQPSGRWKLDAAMHAFRCQPNRGHEEYSIEPCK